MVVDEFTNAAKRPIPALPIAAPWRWAVPPGDLRRN
jgi:hypothetical protein